jgi:hypothetical protein
VRMADGSPEANVKLAAGYDHLLRMHGLNGGERHEKIACVLDIDHQLGPPVRRDLPDGAECMLAIGDENLKPFLDLLAHRSVSIDGDGLARRLPDGERMKARSGAYNLLSGWPVSQGVS